MSGNYIVYIGNTGQCTYETNDDIKQNEIIESPHGNSIISRLIRIVMSAFTTKNVLSQIQVNTSHYV